MRSRFALVAACVSLMLSTVPVFAQQQPDDDPTAVLVGALSRLVTPGNKAPKTPEQKVAKAARQARQAAHKVFMDRAEAQYQLLLSQGKDPLSWTGFDQAAINPRATNRTTTAPAGSR